MQLRIVGTVCGAWLHDFRPFRMADKVYALPDRGVPLTLGRRTCSKSFQIMHSFDAYCHVGTASFVLAALCLQRAWEITDSEIEILNIASSVQVPPHIDVERHPELPWMSLMYRRICSAGSSNRL